ncbi:MAG: lytic murein transglycosylase, partial [Aquabacterium sp.]
YAGAIGLGQFMPSSILRHAVDFDTDGKVDMSRSPADVIGSVARYLSDYKWTPGMPARYAVAVPDDAEALQRLLAPDIEPTFDATQMEAAGAKLDGAGRAHAGALALVKLENGDAAPSYVAGTANFYTVTRYNRSSYYAMAVIELGEAVAAAMR